MSAAVCGVVAWSRVCSWSSMMDLRAESGAVSLGGTEGVLHDIHNNKYGCYQYVKVNNNYLQFKPIIIQYIVQHGI